MSYIFLGAILITAILIGFTLLSIVLLSKNVNKNLKEKSLELLSYYDIELENKSKRLSEIEEEINKKAKINTTYEDKPKEKSVETKATSNSSDILNIVQTIGEASYRDKDILKIYKKIKRSFVTTPEKVKKALDKIEKCPCNKEAEQLLNKLPYKTVYELSTLPVDTQNKLLKEYLSEDEYSLYTKYLETNKKSTILGFYNYLKSIVKKDSNVVELYISKYDYGKEFPKDLKIILDENICEGFIIKYNNTIYDYSMKENENE